MNIIYNFVIYSIFYEKYSGITSFLSDFYKSYYHSSQDKYSQAIISGINAFSLFSIFCFGITTRYYNFTVSTSLYKLKTSMSLVF